MLLPGIVEAGLPRIGFGWTMRVLGFVMLAFQGIALALARTRVDTAAEDGAVGGAVGVWGSAVFAVCGWHLFLFLGHESRVLLCWGVRDERCGLDVRGLGEPSHRDERCRCRWETASSVPRGSIYRAGEHDDSLCGFVQCGSVLLACDPLDGRSVCLRHCLWPL